MLRALVLAAAVLLPAVQSPAGEIARGSTEIARGSTFHVIVNRSNTISELTRAEVSAMFMKRIRSWRDGAEIMAVDQPARSALRESFSREIHEKSTAFVSRYWQRLIFAGRGIPPPELPTDEEVMAFVAKNRGAIGYVSTAVDLNDDVKAIAVTR